MFGLAPTPNGSPRLTPHPCHLCRRPLTIDFLSYFLTAYLFPPGQLRPSLPHRYATSGISREPGGSASFVDSSYGTATAPNFLNRTHEVADMTGDQQRRYIGSIAGMKPLLDVIELRPEPRKTDTHNNMVIHVVWVLEIELQVHQLKPWFIFSSFVL